MTELITQIILYAYPLWALTAFVMGMVKFLDYFYLDGFRRSFLWGIVFLGWALAFFGAGLLIARVGDRETLVPTIMTIWIAMFPVFAITVGMECAERWRILQMIDAAQKRRRNGNPDR